jgi:hypothetical protein
VDKVQEEAPANFQDTLDGILRFLLLLTNGNLKEENPYPTFITPLNHPKYKKYATENEKEGIFNGSVTDLSESFSRHYEDIKTLKSHPKSVFNTVTSTDELAERAHFSHAGVKRTNYLFGKKISKNYSGFESLIGMDYICTFVT